MAIGTIRSSPDMLHEDACRIDNWHYLQTLFPYEPQPAHRGVTLHDRSLPFGRIGNPEGCLPTTLTFPLIPTVSATYKAESGSRRNMHSSRNIFASKYVCGGIRIE